MQNTISNKYIIYVTHCAHSFCETNTVILNLKLEMKCIAQTHQFC